MPTDKKKKTTRPTTTVRLPPDLHAEVKDAAERAGHSMNDEIIERLRTLSTLTSGTVTLKDVVRQNEKTQAMVQQIIDAISPQRR
jgi:predicted DNA-binding protein